MPIYGFLPATDPRMRSTIEAIARDLTEDGLVLRYRAEEGLNADGLTGEEGTFVICSFWLVSCLAQAGEVERAEALFDQLAGYANDLGLLGEEIDTANGEQLGNFPQAYSHIGLITAAYEIDKARGAGMSPTSTSSSSAAGPPGSTAPRGSPTAACGSRSSSASCSAASAPTGAASPPRRSCVRARRCRPPARRRGAREAVAGRRRRARRSRGATSWSPATTTPARPRGPTARASRCCAARAGSTAPGRVARRRRDLHRAPRRASPPGRIRSIPPVPGLRELDGVWTNREATGLTEVPRRLLVLGGGPVGLELGQALARMGASVAIVEGAEHLLAREPAPLGEAIAEALAADGIELHLGRHAAAARREGDDYVLELADGTELRGDRLLVATGRRPRTAGLGLETRRASTADRGRRAHARRATACGRSATSPASGR